MTCSLVKARWIVLAAAAALASCQLDVLSPRGPVGAEDRTILLDSLVIMLAIVVPTIVVALAFAWWFRAGNTKARYLPTWDFSGRVELVVWSIPLMTIILLGGVAWIGAHRLDPAERAALPAGTPLEIQVVSLDWKWLFIYPGQHVAAVNQLVVPAGVPLHFTLTSASVMNAFFVPRLGSMIYTMNGMATELNLAADTPGTFRGQSAHFSGDGFSDMHFEVRALPAAEFTSWVQSAQAGGTALDEARYRQLEQQSLADAPVTFSSVPDGLFQSIVMQHLPPGPGPAPEPRPQTEASRALSPQEH